MQKYVEAKEADVIMNTAAINFICEGCGFYLGDVFPAYQRLVFEYSKGTKQKLFELIDFSQEELSIEFIFKALGLDNQCCRNHIMGSDNYMGI